MNKIKADGTTRQEGGDHYLEMGIQPWDVMKSWMTSEQFRGFLRGNVIKYIARAGKKDGAVEEVDLKKAAHYLEALIYETMKGE